MQRVTPEQWDRVKEVFEAALECAPNDRPAFLGQACGGDELLLNEVKSLLSSYSEQTSFMETPAVQMAAQSLTTEEGTAQPGQQIGHYRLVREIGRGGMGIVYLAQDLSLGRPVALKLLPVHLTSDPDRLRRFEREARTASALNHPNVCVIHEVGKTDDHRHFIAMEYIEGMTLRQHMLANRIELREALHVAVQVASASVASQRAGIVHRDIKPENIMLRTDGYVKVLDFGLAKLTEAQAIGSEATKVMTRTDTGVVMGTAHYMSPEQARGLSIDARTDIFSLGVVLYEMVTGRVPFEGETPSHVIVAILETEPAPLVSHLPDVPTELQRIVSKALAKDTDERYQTFENFLLDLKGVSHDSKSEPKIETGTRSASRSSLPPERIIGKQPFALSRWIWLSIAMMLVIVGGAWVYFPRGASEPTLPAMKVAPFTSFLGFEFNPSFSPDGNFMAFCWGGEKDDNIDVYIQRIGSSGPPFRLTSDPAVDFHPVWSPDGTQIAFARFKSETEKAIFIKPALGGPERKIYSPTMKAIWGGAKNLDWSPDGKFFAAPNKLSPEGPYHIFLISPETFEQRQLTFAPGNSFGDLGPQFSPDGKSLAFIRGNNLWGMDIYVVAVASGEPQRLTFGGQHIEGLTWTADGRRIVYSSNRGGMQKLWSVLASGGTPELLAVGETGASSPSISHQLNRLAFAKKVADTNIYRISLDRSASRSSASRFASSTQLDWNPGFSPNGKRIAFESERSGQHEIWLCNSDGSDLIQLTSLATYSGSPSWSPDGQRIAFDSREEGGATANIYVISSQGGSRRRLTAEDDYDDIVPSWSRDGQWIYFASKRSGDWQVWKVPAMGGEPVQVTKRGGYVAFESSDGKSVYYAKDQSSPGIWRVSVDGGEEVPVLDSVAGYWGNWAVGLDGIYYIEPETKNGAAIEFFSFATRRITEVASLGKVSVSWVGFAVSPDGQWALYTLVDQEGSDIMLVENFH